MNHSRGGRGGGRTEPCGLRCDEPNWREVCFQVNVWIVDMGMDHSRGGRTTSKRRRPHSSAGMSLQDSARKARKTYLDHGTSWPGKVNERSAAGTKTWLCFLWGRLLFHHEESFHPCRL